MSSSIYIVVCGSGGVLCIRNQPILKMGFKVKLNKAVLRFFYIVFFFGHINIARLMGLFQSASSIAPTITKKKKKTEEKPCMFNLPSVFVSSTTLFPKTESHVSGIADPSIVVCIW